MKLGMRVGLVSGHIVLDGDPAPHGKGHSSPSAPHSKFTGAGFGCVHIIRGPCLLWPNGWMDQGELGTEVGFGPGHTVLDGDPAAVS